VSTTFQICVDCGDPHRMVRFWAEALGYEIEDHAPLVAQLLEAGAVTEADTLVVDGQRVWRDAAACHDVSGDGRPRLLFQSVPEAKTVKNRLHLDLHVGPEQRDGLVDRLTALGARRIGEGTQGPNSWIVMADPEGHEFCVA
jgi:catechol 2,3-dioxygenase-like lactoylglutathione lyase family enzyme